MLMIARLPYSIIAGVVLSFLLFWQPAQAQVNVPAFTPKPVPSWVKQYAIKLPLDTDTFDINLPLIHSEAQANHAAEAYYEHYAYYITNVAGLNEISSYYTTYEPHYQQLDLHQINIYRDGKRLPLDEQLHVEFEIEGKQIGGERYDDDAKVSVYFDKAQVGDVLEVSHTTYGHQPDLHGALHYNWRQYSWRTRGRNIYRVLAAPDQPIQYFALNNPVAPKPIQYKGLHGYECSYHQTTKQPGASTPDWHQARPRVYFYSHTSWADLNALNLKNFRLDEAPSPEIQSIVQSLTESTASTADNINRVLQ